jgi:N-acetyl-alpha-D-glucosaminyl L-malate synthase BshA
VNIGILCYASVGGSGVVATELAHALALGGHDVHLISTDLPFRWRSVPGLSFERVETPAYPLFRQPQYLLTLTSTIVRLARRRPLDLVHAHYAVPHATAAYLAHQIIQSDPHARSIRTVTTLHGTDITLVGSDPSYASVVAFSIEQSHGVTAVSESLRQDTVRTLGIRQPVRVIPNFLDCQSYRRGAAPALRERLCPAAGNEALVVHVSNFRPVKRVGIVVEVFRRIREQVRARLVMIGDGPDRAAAERQVLELGLSDAVEFVGEQPDVVPWLSAADLFLLTSSQESFGMAALEAMACEVPVVATRVGGVPEVIEDGVTGFLCDLNDIHGMTERAVRLVRDRDHASAIGRNAAEVVRRKFCREVVVPQYEAFYRDVLQTAG